MKKLTLIALITSLGFLSGCETAAQFNNMRNSDQAAYSCDQIYSAFKAYDMDRDSAVALAAISGMINPELASAAATGDYYTRIKMSANIALITQGCQPLT